MRCEECQFDNPPDSLTCQKCQGKLYHAKLRVTIEDGEIQTHYLYPQKYSIGRGTENEIVIRDDSVSRLHAQIAYEDGSFVICDNESKNGSLLNDHHFKRRKLHDLDCIQLGNVVIHFYDEKHRASHLRQGMDTAEWVQREFFRYARNGQANITTDDLLLTMLDLAVSLIHADQAVILQFDVSRKLRFKIGKKQKGQTILENNLTDFDWNMIRNAMSRKAPEIVCSHDGSEGSDDDLFDTSAWYKIAMPLVSTSVEEDEKKDLGIDGVLGILLLTREREKSEITQRKKELLGTIVQQITFAIENEMLFEQALEKRRIDKELSLAKEIQNKLLPISNPSKEHFEIASFIHPCETVSGDYFDFFAISPTVIGIAIGDICGKGVPAALLTSTVQAAIHSQLEYTESPEQIIRNLNRLLIRNTAESIFLTLFFGLIDLESNQFKYVNAGHPPPIFIQKKSRIKELGGTAPALGVFEGNFDSERSIKFEPGDILVMYTDGLIEGQNPERKIYGRRRLLKQVDVLFSERNTQLDTLNAVVDSITDDIIHFIGGAKQQDDLTLLAVRRR